ncbi:MAG: MEDS domain-containing protein [Candidatus Manganitrophus sp.]|nr:MEDS domain-containing protein [Candidatus Manganitrophus sp.]WDT72483.1 MAG: MEDS domain-containing protein [Candidatus Manganitrophus sp.]WDT80061.1 MAG: MEDS domain-containing protein [Candidatus Manganitrophus sp.]
MKRTMRKTGIDPVGDMPWGTHFCSFYESKEDLLHTLVPFFKTGLENNELCLWVFSRPLTEEEIKSKLRQAVPDLDRHLTERNIEIVPHDRWYLEENALNLTKVMNGCDEKIDQSLSRGYDGLRFTGDGSWIQRHDWKSFSEYEKGLNTFVADKQMIIFCTYPLAASGAAEILDVARAHQFTVARRKGDWEMVETPEMKEAKAEIKRLNDTLEQRVIERTRELIAANEALKNEIVERKRAEERIRRHEKRLADIVNTLPVGVWVTDETGNIILSNQAGREIWAGAKYVGIEQYGEYKGWWAETGERIGPEEWAAVGAVQRGESSLNEVIDIESFDGKRKTILNSAVPLFDEGRRIIGALVVNQDITEQRKAEQAIRRSEQHLRDVMNSLIFFAGVLTPDGLLREVNRAALDAAGLRAEEVLGRPFEKARWWSYSAQIQAQLRDAIRRAAGGETVRYDVAIRIQGEQFITIDFGLAPMFDATGNVINLVPSGVDITERKRVEEEIKKLNTDLEKRVAERTAELETANRELETFSYSVSHDLRAPLRAIVGFSRVLMIQYPDRLDPQGKDFLQRIDAAGRRMGELIEDLLNLSRVTRSEMRKEPADLTLLARSIAAELQRSEPERKATFLIRENLTVSADPRLLKIVLENLMGNAWKFTSKHPTATIELGAVERDGKKVYFIRDDGAGFDMAYAEKLFNPFRRLHNAKEFVGTGIGLATVQRIIDRHGGQIWAEGEVEGGATFYFTM